MARRIASVACLVALVATYAVAVAAPLLASDAACCAAAWCHLPQQRNTPAKPHCDAMDHGLSDCSMQSCNPPEHKAVGLQPYILGAPMASTSEIPAAFLTPRVEPVFSSLKGDIDSPPPRLVLA